MFVSQNLFTISGIVYGTLSVIIVTFSSLVLITIISHWRSECRSTANLLTCNSCVALLVYGLMLLIQVPFVVRNTTQDINTVFCRIRSFVYTCATLAVGYSFSNMAVSCYFQTILYKHRLLVSFRAHWLIIVLSWLATLTVTIGTFLVPSAYIYEPESGLCVLTSKCFLAAFIISVAVFTVSVSVIVTLYGIIILHITRQRRVHPNSQSTQHASRNVKVFKKIFLFIGMLLAGGGPFFFSTILHRVGYDLPELILVVHVAIASGVALNSIALLWTNPQVKQILLANFISRKSRPDDNGTKHAT